MTTPTDDVLAAAAAMVSAFGAHDVAGYFASFDPEATFLFHNLDHLVTSRADYEDLWRAWEKDGFQVIACRSLEPRAQQVSTDSAVFTHRVRTTLAGQPQELPERETIVFRRDPDGRWLGVHEHLSLETQESAGIWQ
jgi:ketosteroid isomerase-like protein